MEEDVSVLSSVVRASLRYGRPHRPQIDPEPMLQTGDRGEVGPRRAVDDVCNDGVVDAGHVARPSETSAVQGHSEVDGEQPRRLRDRVGTRTGGPVTAEAAGRISLGPGHTGTVPKRREQSGDEGGDTAGLNDVGSYQRQASLFPGGGESAVGKRVGGYTPKMPADYWEVIGDFVRAVVLDAQPKTPYSASDLLNAAAALTLWCWQTAGLELERNVVFDRYTIEEFIASGCHGWSPSGRGNRRSQLFRIAEAVLGPEAGTMRLAPLPRPNPSEPYSSKEIADLKAWARGRNTVPARRDAWLLLGLGLGGGLAVQDFGPLYPKNVVVDSDGVLIQVIGKRPRIVPVLVEWEQTIIDALDGADPNRFLFRPGRTKTTKNLVDVFFKAQGGPHRPSTHRLRATWIVRHLAARTPVIPLMRAAGVESLDALTRYLRFVPDLDPSEVRAALRAEATAP